MKYLRLWVLAGTGLLATLFWDSPMLLPLKLLVVLVHESSHGLAALIFGGMLQEISLNLNESGETLVSGLVGTPAFVVALSAGYIGVGFTGAIFVDRGLSAKGERLTLGIFSLLLFYMTLLFSPFFSPGFYTGVAWSLVLLLPVFVGPTSSRLALLVLGGWFLWYCMYDLFDFTRDIASTDAFLLASYLQEEGAEPEGLARFISVVWAVILIAMAMLSLRPVFVEHRPAEPPQEMEDELENDHFPGEMSGEVEDWLLRRGLDIHGRPFLPEGMDLQQQPVSEHGENPKQL